MSEFNTLQSSVKTCMYVHLYLEYQQVHYDDICELLLSMFCTYMFRLFLLTIMKAYTAILRVQVKRFV
jgi:hypothetical protein